MQTMIRAKVVLTACLLALPFTMGQAMAQSCVPGLGMTTSDLLFGLRSRPAPPQADFKSFSTNGGTPSFVSPKAILGVSANHAYVIDGGTILALTYNPTSNLLTGGPVSITGVYGSVVAMAWDGTYLWGVTSSGYFGATGGTVTGPPRGGSVSGTPTKMIYDGKYLWISTTTGTLYRVLPSPIASPVVTPVRLGIGVASIIGLTFDGQYVWAALQSPIGTAGTLFKVDPSTAVVAASYNVGAAGPITFDGYSIWVAGLNYVFRYNAATGQSTGSYPAADARSLFFDGSQMWVANRGANAITPIRACDGASSMKPMSTPAYPENVGFDGTNLWVTSLTSLTVSIR
jgi:hypothetical protein